MKILIVDDERVSQKKINFMLSKYGYCDVVWSGEEAIKLFKKSFEIRSPYDIVTLDIGLRDMSGIDILVEIRKIENEMGEIGAFNKTKVIMVTSHGDQEYITTSIAAGCNGYIVKPFTTVNITNCLRDIYTKYIEETFPKV